MKAWWKGLGGSEVDECDGDGSTDAVKEILHGLMDSVFGLDWIGNYIGVLHW